LNSLLSDMSEYAVVAVKGMRNPLSNLIKVKIMPE
jgi:hypothetical protein